MQRRGKNVSVSHSIIIDMNLTWLLRRVIVAIALWLMSCLYVTAQAGPAGNQAQSLPVRPLTTQIKNTVVFLQTDCLHDFGPDIAQWTPDALAKLPTQQLMMIKGQLIMSAMRLQTIKQSRAKLSSEELGLLKPEALSRLEA